MHPGTEKGFSRVVVHHHMDLWMKLLAIDGIMIAVEESEECQSAIVDTGVNKKRGIFAMLYAQKSCILKKRLSSCQRAFTHFLLDTVGFPKLTSSQLLTCRWNCQLGGGVEDRFVVVVMGIEDEASSSGNCSFVVDQINTTDILLCLVEMIGTSTKTADS